MPMKKKKITMTVIIGTIITILGFNFKQSKNRVRLSDLALKNVEALAGVNADTSCTSDNPGPYCGIFIDVWGNGTKVYYP